MTVADGQGHDAPPILSVRALRASIARQQVVEDATFDVAASGVTALVGRNGAGKTSTLRGILGLIERRGEVVFDGTRIDAMPTHRIVRLGIGYVPEDRDVFGSLTVAENLRLAERDGAPGAATVRQLFPDLVARSGQRAGTLSGGQQQMVSLARALLNDNRMLLVDEPTKGLSPRVLGEVVQALEVAAASVPILLVEQNLQVVRRLASRVVVMENGRVVLSAPAQQVLEDRDLLERHLGVGIAGRTAAEDDVPVTKEATA